MLGLLKKYRVETAAGKSSNRGANASALAGLNLSGIGGGGDFFFFYFFRRQLKDART
jgi:hypothetical protein